LFFKWCKQRLNEKANQKRKRPPINNLLQKPSIDDNIYKKIINRRLKKLRQFVILPESINLEKGYGACPSGIPERTLA